MAVINGTINLASRLFVRDARASRCPVSEGGRPFGLLIIIDFFEKWFGFGLDKLKGQLRRWLDWTCPTGLPSEGDVNAIWLGDDITDAQWDNLIRANNQCPEWQRRLRHTIRTQPNIEQLFASFLRGDINEETLKGRARGAGVIDTADYDIFAGLSRFYPGAQDVVRFMTRDVFDPSVVANERLSEDFEKKYTFDARKLARANGVPDEQMLNYWRAHWVLASPQQLFEMLHRLRPGRVSNELAVTRDDVLSRLKQADYSPWAADHLIEMSYHVNRLVDIRNMFYLGVIDETELKEQFLDRGSNERDAQLIVGLIQNQKRRRGVGAVPTKNYVDRRSDWPETLQLLRNEGYSEEDAAWIKGQADLKRVGNLKKALSDPVIKASIDRAVPWGEVGNYLSAQGYTDDEIDLLKFDVDQRARARLQARCVAALRRRYLLGETAPGEMVALLVQGGVTPEDAQELVQAWQCELLARGKHLTGSQLCKYAAQGLINLTEYAVRLARLGYDEREAGLIITSCQIDIREKAAAEAERRRKAREAAQRKGQQEAERKRKEAERAAVLAGKKRTTMTKRAQSYATRFTKVAQMIADLEQTEFNLAAGSLENEVGHLHNAYGMTAEGGLGMVEQIVKDATKAQDGDWIGRVREAEQFFPAVPPEPEFPNGQA